MSIQRDRRNSLKLGRWCRLVEVHCDFLKLCYKRRYYYANTQGRLLREKPLLSLQRWCRTPTETIRSYYIIGLNMTLSWSGGRNERHTT